MISVVVPAHRADAALAECLRALAHTSTPHETIVVDDGSTDQAVSALAREHGAIVVRNEHSEGPAVARNRGSDAATGDTVLFIDSDVVVHADTLATIDLFLDRHPDVGALFGSYDTTPRAKNLVSQFKNLTHHYVHQQANPDAFTFWAGCGAVRRSIFREVGGFDESYRRPCIEDIELGYRLRQRGVKIAVVKDAQVTHLKRWTLAGLVRTDIFDRGVPWLQLILSHPESTAGDLNLSPRSRWSLVLTWLALAALLLTPWQPSMLIASLLCVVAVVVLSADYFRWLVAQRGLAFAVGGVALHLVYHLYSGVSAIIGTAQFVRRDRRDSAAEPVGPQARAVAGNFAALAGGELVSRALGFAATLYLARTVGVGAFGRLEVGLAVVSYLQIAVDGGLDTIAIRSVARQPDQRAHFADNLLGIRLSLAALTLIVTALGMAFSSPPHPVGDVVWRYALGVLPLAASLGWAFQADQRMGTVAIGGVLTQLCSVGAMVMLVTSPAQLLSVPLIYVTSMAVGSLFVGVRYAKRFGVPRPRLNRAFAAPLGRQAWPVAGARALRTVSYNFDIVILGVLFPSLSVGLYAAAYRLLTLPLLGYSMLSTAVFPGIVRLTGTSRRRAAIANGLAVGTSSLMVAAVLGGWAATWLALAAGPAFAGGADILRWLAFSIPLTAIAGVFRQWLVASDRQSADLIVVAIGACVNGALNLLLIPKLGLRGAATATIIGEAAVLVSAMLLVARGTARQGETHSASLSMTR